MNSQKQGTINLQRDKGWRSEQAPLDFAPVAVTGADLHVLPAASFPSLFLRVWPQGHWNRSRSVLIDQPAIYSWHCFSFPVGSSASLSRLGSSGQDTAAVRAWVHLDPRGLGADAAVGAEECARPCVPQQVCGGILIMLLVELHLLLAFRTPEHFHNKMLGYIYLSHHQSPSLKFLSRKHLSCAVRCTHTYKHTHLSLHTHKPVSRDTYTHKNSHLSIIANTHSVSLSTPPVSR